MKSLTGKRAWITAASSGIGATTAKALGKELDALGGVDILRGGHQTAGFDTL